MKDGLVLVLVVAAMATAIILLLLALLNARRRLAIARKEQAATASRLDDCTRTATSQASDLALGREVQRAFFPIPPDSSGRRPPLYTFRTGTVEICGYHKCASDLGGNFFDWQRVLDNTYLILHGAVAGHGLAAALLAVEIATVFREWCRGWQPNARIEQLLCRINDVVEGRGIQGRFAAIRVGLIDVRTGEAKVANAGYNEVLLFRASEKKLVRVRLPDSPVAGTFSTDLILERWSFKVVPLELETGDLLVFLSEGIEDSQRKRRAEASEAGEPEFFGIDRVQDILESVMNRRKLTFQGGDDPRSLKRLSFDFSGCTGTATEAVLALVAAEKVFRLTPRPQDDGKRRVEVEEAVDRFLDRHFEQYSRYFSSRTASDGDAEPCFDHLEEEPNYNDISIVAVRRTDRAEPDDREARTEPAAGHVPVATEELRASDVTEAELEELPVVDDDVEELPVVDEDNGS